MPVPDRDTMERWREMVVVDRDDTTVGTVSEFYLDRETGQPTWVLLNTGLVGSKRTFVPLVEATERGGEVHLPYRKRQVNDAPQVSIDGELTPDEEARLLAWYGIERPAG